MWRMTMAVVQALVLWLLLWLLVIAAMVAFVVLAGVGVGPLTHFQQTPLALALTLVLGLVIDSVGGWRAARLAGENEKTVSAAFGAVVMTLAAGIVVLSPAHARSPLDLVGIAATIPAAVIGGLLARR